jgi:peptide/nickel transport system substrate-binding protein
MTRSKTLATVAMATVLVVGSVSLSFGQTLRVSNIGNPPNHGDPTTSLSYQHTYTFETSFDPLVTVDGDGSPRPRLATSWKNTGPLTWEFKLKPGISFHAGTAFNADAVVAAVKNLQSDDQKKFGGSVYGSLKHIVDARKIDDLTVEIITSRPAPILPNEISAFRIIDPAKWSDLGRENFGNNPSGTGPFRVTSWDDTKAQMVRFENGPRQPKVDGLLMYFQPEAATRVQAFQSEAVDIAFGIPTDSANLIKQAGGTVNVGSTPSVAILVFNQSTGGITTDKRVRQAFNYAIDKSFIDTLFNGFGKAAGQPAASSVNGFQADVQAYPYDPAKAKQLLAEAGFPNGLSVVAEIVNNNADLSNLYQQVAQDLSKVGVTMELKIITLPDLFGRVVGTKEFEGQMHIMNYGSNPSIDMMRSINAFHSCEARQKWTCIPAAEAAIKGANSEFDPKKRAQYLREIAQIYHEEAPQIFLYEQFELDATSSKVSGFKNENWRINWADIALAK